MEKNLKEKIEEITNSLNEETIKSASNEELMGYLIMVEKMKKKLEKLVNLEK